MATMGKYCKAYSLETLRKYSGWSEDIQNARPLKSEANGKEVEEPRLLTDEDYLYLQENFTVTDGIFLDEGIIFDRVTPEWIEYCEEELEFEVPVYDPMPVS